MAYNEKEHRVPAFSWTYPNIFISPGKDEAVFQDKKWDWDRYQKTVRGALTEIMKHNWTGLGVLNEISRRGRAEGKRPISVVISPQERGICNPEVPPWMEVETDGLVVRVLYLGYDLGPAGECGARGDIDLPDEVLLHELVHALRDIEGRPGGSSQQFDPKYKFEGFAYDNSEEFIAILLTNIYMSARGRGFHRIRKDHRSEAPLYSELCWSNTFFWRTQHIRMVDQFVRWDRFICESYVKNDVCCFNPVRHFLLHRDELMRILDPPKAPAAPSDADRDAARLLEEQVRQQTYVTKSNDTLAGIAQKFYGDPKLWKAILDANRKTVGSHGSPQGKLTAGKEIFIPPRSAVGAH